MRVEAYTQVQQLYNANKTKKSKDVETVKPKDRFEISEKGKEMQLATNAVAAAPDIRSELVDPIKTSMKNGTYEVSGDSFAERLIQKYEEATSL